MSYCVVGRFCWIFFGSIACSFSSGLSPIFDNNFDSEGAKYKAGLQVSEYSQKQECNSIHLLVDSSEKSSEAIRRLEKIESEYNKLDCNIEEQCIKMKDLFKEHLKICILLLSRGEMEPGYLCEYFGCSPWQKVVREMIKLDGKQLSEEVAYATGVYLCSFVMAKNGQVSKNVSLLYRNAIEKASTKQDSSGLLVWAINCAKNDQTTQKLASTLKPVLDFVKNDTCLDK